jgi:two-component system, cell cycle sensor histidine kinase and response regulator CckA
MPDGGTLLVETRTVDLGEHSTQLHGEMQPGRFVELSVSDTGTGMSPEITAHALEPFYTTKAAGQGSGLGLATVYGIVSEGGGAVEIDSQVGTGTTFRVYLPPSEVPDETTPDCGAPVALPGRGETILVVEDEPAMLTVATRLLERNGYRVLAAASADEAIGIAATHDFALLLTDSVMPKMSGSALAEQLRSARPDLAVLFMSGYSHGVGGRERLTENDAVLIQKPFTEHDLLVTVAAALPG